MSRRAIQRRPGVAAACAGLAVSAGFAQPVVQAPTVVDSRKGLAKSALGPIGASLPGDVPEVRVGPLDLDLLRREDEQAAAAGDRRFRYGIGREVRGALEDGRWDEVPGGRLWQLDIAAEGAVGIRVHLAGLRLPPGATLVVYPPDEPTEFAGPYVGSGPHGDGTIWTPTRGRGRVRIECYFPHAASRQAGNPFQIDAIQQMYRDPMAPVLPDGPCHNDITCHPAWLDVARACGGVGFINQNSIFCSGQLINTVASDHTPYFLTSETCVNSPTVAQSCEVYFGYRTLTCNGTAPPPQGVPRAVGCTLLASSAAQDFSLLMIEGTLPAGVAWAGWTTATPPNGSPVAAVHYPQGEPERISFGNTSPNPTCGGAGFIRSNWTSGPTEPGSGGGGLFTDDASRRLIGVLSCGWSSCGNLANDNFSPFSAIHAQTAALLAVGMDDAFEPNDRCGSAFSITPGVFSYRIVKDVSEDWFRATVMPGATFSAQVAHTHVHGDIDAALYSECDAVLLSSSSGQTGTETVSWTNPGVQAEDVFLRVYLASDTRNSYTLSIANGAPPGMGACCLPAGCSLMSQSACIAGGGVFAGGETTCPSGCVSYAYAGPPISIDDGTGSSTCAAAAVAEVLVPESFTISGVSVGVRITHGYQGDLKFLLKHLATGTSVVLVDRPGSPPSTFGFPNDNYGANVTSLFRSLDSAAQRYDSPVIGIDNVAGPWKPEGVLAAFVGENAAGVWQLQVQDCAGGESGQLVAFSLVLGRASSSACYANCDSSTTAPVLTANDFLCFINRYSNGESWANCDGSTVAPVLTANDFQCFLSSYVAGCS